MRNYLKEFENYQAVNIGYARVSTDSQELGLLVQKDALNACDLIVCEKDSGGKDDRRQFKQLLALAKRLARKGKVVTITIYKLDRLTRKMSTLLKIIEDLNAHEIKLVSLKENIETDSLTGRLLVVILGYVAEMELEAIRSRTKEGLRKAKEKGVRLGNRGIGKQLEQKIITLYSLEKLPVKEIAKACNLSVATIYNVLNRNQIPINRRKTRKSP